MLVGAVSAAAAVDDDAAELARADAVALNLEAEPSAPVIAPRVKDWGLDPIEVDVELDKQDVTHLRDAQAAARNAERQALAEQQAAEQQAAQQQAQQQPATQQQESAAEEPSDASASDPEAEPLAASAGGERGSLAGMVNSYRGQNGRAALSRNGTLDQVAQNWAQWMASNQTLQHNPNYASQIGGGWARSGENIVRNTGARSWSSGDITSWMFNWWRNSGVHRANMLNGAYTHIGVGYAMGSGGPYAVLLFGGR